MIRVDWLDAFTISPWMDEHHEPEDGCGFITTVGWKRDLVEVHGLEYQPISLNYDNQTHDFSDTIYVPTCLIRDLKVLMHEEDESRTRENE